MQIAGAVLSIIGALDAFPRRLAASEIAAQGGTLRRGLSRRTDILVFGHRAFHSWRPDRILSRLEECKTVGAHPISENAFLRLLGLRGDSKVLRQLSRQAMIDQSGLSSEAFDVLVLFDAFDFSEPPFGFRDLVAAKQFARVLDNGAEWPTLIRTIRSVGHTPSAISSLRLECSPWNDVVVRNKSILVELNGQLILSLAHSDGEGVDELFDGAEEAEDRQDWDRAAALYLQCLAIDPHDPIIPFNLSHVLIEKREWNQAQYYLIKALKLDPDYAEAWYNLAAVARGANNTVAAKRHLEKAIAADPMYSDPIYNLALLEFENGDYGEASRLWTKYLELDPRSDWGRRAKRGLQLIKMMAAGSRRSPHRAEPTTA